jgi:pimeloyl-ACP methyl ester carboxylesterase
MSKVTIENKEVYYEIHGTGAPVIMLHGFLESLTMWHYYAKDLSKTHQVILIDLPGHGRTEVFPEHHMDDMAKVVFKVLDHLGVENAPIIGHSMGGYVALAMADQKPELKQKILLFFSSAAADTPEKKINRERLKSIVKDNKEIFSRHAIPMLFTPKTRALFKPVIDQLIEEAIAMDTNGITKTIDGLKLRPNREHVLENTSVSFISGKLDEAVPFDSLTQQHKAKGVEKVWVTENGHMGHIEDRDYCLAAIQEFLA